ncbi:ribosome small subunit-dependent GTPase A [Mycoplasma sp. ATU-Cv-508]|uniref:ribosome small subunit-dependent GTPase A n=1 Tax=Mycoplasma sp. ATU-Cv-508 TaxID=2048001 RepID=UPI000FDD6514
MRGLVRKVIAGFYDLETESGQIYRVRGSGKLRHEQQSPWVGDYVEFKPEQLITQIYPRKNQLTRPEVANVDQVLLVTSVFDPVFSTFWLDKNLAIVEAKGINPVLVFTKTDLADPSPWLFYAREGYQVFPVNTLDLKTILPLRAKFAGQINVAIGRSGVGKSTLINKLAKLELPTGEISTRTRRGKQTTRVIEMVDFLGGKLVDTPGFETIELGLSKTQLAHAYHDFHALSSKCSFGRSCLHQHEQDCAVKKAVKNGIISLSRYENYLKLLNQI